MKTDINILKALAALKRRHIPYRYDSRLKKYFYVNIDEEIEPYKLDRTQPPIIYTTKELFDVFDKTLFDKLYDINNINYSKINCSSYEELFTDKFFGYIPYKNRNIITILLHTDILYDDKNDILKNFILDFQSFKKTLFKVKELREEIIGGWKETKVFINDIKDNNKKYIFYIYTY